MNLSLTYLNNKSYGYDFFHSIVSLKGIIPKHENTWKEKDSLSGVLSHKYLRESAYTHAHAHVCVC